MSFKEVLRKHWRYIVVSLSLLIGIALLSQNVFTSVGASTIQAAVPAVPAVPANPASHTLAGDPKTKSRCPGTSSAGVCDHTQQSVEGAITDTDTPTSTET